jgi:proline iminopeptidase
MPYLPVGDKHTLYYEEHGNPAGRPVVVLHGGPGGGLQRSVLRFFDLRKWRVVLYDQRGCGRSKPRLSLHANTTPHLVSDIERLREHLGIKSWTVFGGSWGSTLALAYAIKHRGVVDGLILRGIFLAEPWETAWMYAEGGASQLLPREWKRFAAGCPSAAKGKRNLTACYRRRLANRRTRRAAARAWWDWEAALSAVEHPVADRTPPKAVEELAVLENHYFSHGCWLKPGELLRGAAAALRDMPTTIVQGELDLVCPPAAAAALAAAMPHARLVLVPGAGHAASEPSIAKALTEAVKRHAKI